MKKFIVSLTRRTITVLLTMVMIISCFVVNVNAAEDEDKKNDQLIVVSLGDSYSSGEGIPPFIGQEKKLKDRVKDQNWLAHRSTQSWPSQLVIEGKRMAKYNADFFDSDDCKWYFRASSGALTEHLNGQGDKDDWNFFKTKIIRKAGEQKKKCIFPRMIIMFIICLSNLIFLIKLMGKWIM